MADISTLPAYEYKMFARRIATMAEVYFSDPEVVKRFEEWKKKRQQSANSSTSEKLLMEGGERVWEVCL